MSALRVFFALQGAADNRLTSRAVAEKISRDVPGAATATECIFLRDDCVLSGVTSSSLATDHAGLYVVADARLTQRPQLFSRLGLQPAARAHTPDAACILTAYKSYGVDCVDKLSGEFAFVVWDEPRRRLLCVRDHLGLKTLYYATTPAGLFIASTAGALFQMGLSPKNINPLRVIDYLVPSLEPASTEDTFYQGVRRLPPAHRLVTQASSSQISCYWKPSGDMELHCSDIAEAAEEFQRLLTEVIEEYFSGGGRTAAMLSGGLDSSLLACVAQPLYATAFGSGLTAISGISPTPGDCPDPDYIRQVQRLLPINAVNVSTQELPAYSASLQDLFARQEEPFDASMVLLFVNYLTARRNGFDSLIDGVDGDLLVSLGDDYMARLLRSGQWRSAWQEFRGMRPIWREEVGPLGLFRHTLLPGLMPNALRGGMYRLRRPGRLQRTLKGTLVSARYAESIGLLDRIEGYHHQYSKGVPQDMTAVHIRRIAHAGLTVGIERYGRVANLCGIQRLSPLLDKRLVEFCVSLPWHLKSRHGQSKVLFRHLLQKHGLDELSQRHDKYGLGWEFSRSWMSLNQARDRALLDAREDSLSPYLDMDAYRRAKKNYFNSAVADDDRIWKAIHLVRWLKHSAATPT